MVSLGKNTSVTVKDPSATTTKKHDVNTGDLSVTIGKEEINGTVFGDDWAVAYAGIKTASCTFTVNMDGSSHSETLLNKSALNDTILQIEVIYDKTQTPNKGFKADALVTSMAMSSSVDGLVTANVTITLSDLSML